MSYVLLSRDETIGKENILIVGLSTFEYIFLGLSISIKHIHFITTLFILHQMYLFDAYRIRLNRKHLQVSIQTSWKILVYREI